MTDEIVLDKKESIERCIKQIQTYYGLPRDAPFEKDSRSLDIALYTYKEFLTHP